MKEFLDNYNFVVWMFATAAAVLLVIQYFWYKWVKTRIHKSCSKCQGNGYITYRSKVVGGEFTLGWCGCKLGQAMRYAGDRADDDPDYDKEAYLKSLSRRELNAFLSINRTREKAFDKEFPGERTP